METKWKVHEMANCCKGVWRSALMLNSVLTKQEIASLGYISMADYYLKVCEISGSAVYGTVCTVVWEVDR